MTLFQRVKDTAKQQGKSLSRVAIESGLGEKSLYKWKDHQPTPDRIKAVANTLGVSIDYLLGNTNDPYSDTDMTVEEKLSKQQIAIGTYLDPNADLDEEAMQKIKDYIYEQTMLAKMRIDAERKRNGN